ncbi:MAG: Rne/Rng family ribonuclease [Firmicutes bacterium]|nr:Rne/Rng family ribonuclease [Bacillota bacterium]
MNDIIIDVGVNQDRVAILENKDLVEFYIERGDNKRVLGNIYKGRVVNVLPGMQAAFVDIGLEKNAFLYVKDAIPKDIMDNKDINLKDISIKDVVKQGQDIIVQVVKEPFGTKGARITTHITLPGRYLVLMPFTDYVGISRRITEDEERERLKGLAEEIKVNNMGIILRTAAEEKSKKDLRDDLNFLLKVYYKIENERNLGFAPRIIYKDLDLVQRTVRDLFTKDTNKLIINDKEKYNSLIDLVDLISPHLKSRVELYENSHNVLVEYGIERKINEALERKVWLKSGGYIIIDETEALTSIDINTGKFVGSVDLEHTVVRTNLEAAKEIAKQLRLRNIGGIIIIDFIDMNNQADDKLVLKTLEKELKKDRTRSTILGMTQLGLVEMTRKKNRKRLSSKMLRDCPCCSGTGKVYSEHTLIKKIENEIKRINIHTNIETVEFLLNPFNCDILEDKYSDYLISLKEKYSIELYIKGDSSINLNDMKVKKMGKIKDKKNNI